MIVPGVAVARPTSVPTVVDALRAATRSRHVRLAASAAMVRLFDPGYTLADYRAHLGRLLGLFEPLERAVVHAADPALPGQNLQRSAALRHDLHTMGATAGDLAALERCSCLPPITRAGVPGYTYVVLGSMLGGQIVVRRLRAVLGPAASFLFYGDGEGRPDPVWASFCAQLEEARGSEVQTICATAVALFDAYAAWLAEPPAGAGNHEPDD